MAELITIGKITNTHGHKGELKIIPLTDFPERFKKTVKVILSHRGRETAYHIESVRNHNNFIIARFKEIPDMNAALEIKGALVQIPREELQPLPEDEYYIFELIGLEVYNNEGEHLGKLTEVIETGANDVYIVKDDNGRELLIPALKKVVREINLKEKRMTVQLLEGL